MSTDDDQDAGLVSLLADGELPAQQLDRALAHLAASADARQTWDSYHLIGEVIRSGHASARAYDPAFVQGLRRKLAQDASEFVAVSARPIRARGQKDIKIESANEGRWRRVAGVASVLLASVLAWQGWALFHGDGLGVDAPLAQVGGRAAVLATAPSEAARPASATGLADAGEPTPVMLRDDRLDALLAAHRQFGGTSALQGPSGFLRNATFDAGQR